MLSTIELPRPLGRHRCHCRLVSSPIAVLAPRPLRLCCSSQILSDFARLRSAFSPSSGSRRPTETAGWRRRFLASTSQLASRACVAPASPAHSTRSPSVRLSTTLPRMQDAILGLELPARGARRCASGPLLFTTQPTERRPLILLILRNIVKKKGSRPQRGFLFRPRGKGAKRGEKLKGWTLATPLPCVSAAGCLSVRQTRRVWPSFSSFSLGE